MEKINLSEDHQKRLVLFQAGFGMTVKSFAKLRGEIHASGLTFPDMLAYVLADLETNLNRLNTLIQTQNLHAADSPGWDGREDDSFETNTEDRRQTTGGLVT